MIGATNRLVALAAVMSLTQGMDNVFDQYQERYIPKKNTKEKSKGYINPTKGYRGAHKLKKRNRR